ncbi:MAG TPA: hypothetical protein DCS93_03030 [Microscillaceae bacterium]|nr:hypothetical protein [Microscillaceae bacterium]
MLKHHFFYYFLFIITFVSGCSSSKSGNNEISDNQATTDSTSKVDSSKTQAEVKPKDLVPTNRKFNDLARLLAGMPAEEGSVVAQYHNSEDWMAYQKVAEKIWKKILNEKRPAMLEWQKKHLQAPNAQPGLLFYPFSGPDFLHASTFYPSATEIVMMGLEPIGNLPDMEKITKSSPKNYYKGLERALYAVLKYSFFITKDMDVDFRGRIDQRIDGTLPALMIFMARTGHRILNYEKVAITPEGTLQSVSLDKATDKKIYYGTKLSFHKEGETKAKTLYFFSVNLSNAPYLGMGGLLQRTDLVKYMKSLKPRNTYLKSASYLMYGGGFSTIRDIILKQSKFVLQDDSGMAFKNFTKGDDWNITLFGCYAGPINLFRHHYQYDMRDAYKKGYPVKELPFGIGYQFVKGNSNLMLAEKK